MKKFTTVLTLLLLMATTASAQWAGRGTGIYMNGQYYALYDTESNYINTIGEYVYELKAPGASISFQAYRTLAGIGNLKVTEYLNDSYQNPFFDQVIARSNYADYGPYSINHNTTKIKFYTVFGATLYKNFKNVIVPMAQYIYAPSATALDFGSADKGDQTSRTFTIAWCNVAGFSWTVTGANAGDVEVSIDENAQAGVYNTSTVTVKYNRANAGNLDAVLTITNGYNQYSHNIQLSGTSIETAVTANMRISAEAKWGTFCAPFDVTLPEGVKAYTGEIQNNGEWIRMTEVGGIVPANTAVVVCAQELNETAEWSFKDEPVTTAGLESCYTPNLTGGVIDIAAGNYLLQMQDGVVGWFIIPGEGFKLAANRCYLTATDNARSFIGLSATDGDATGINSIASEAGTKADGKYMVKGKIVVVKAGKAYDMNGRLLQ